MPQASVNDGSGVGQSGVGGLLAALFGARPRSGQGGAAGADVEALEIARRGRQFLDDAAVQLGARPDAVRGPRPIAGFSRLERTPFDIRDPGSFGSWRSVELTTRQELEILAEDAVMGTVVTLGAIAAGATGEPAGAFEAKQTIIDRARQDVTALALRGFLAGVEADVAAGQAVRENLNTLLSLGGKKAFFFATEPAIKVFIDLAPGLLKAPGIEAGTNIFVNEAGAGEEAQLARMEQRIQAELTAQMAQLRPVVALRVQDADP